MMKRIKDLLRKLWALWRSVPLRARVFCNVVLILIVAACPVYLLCVEAVTKPTDYLSHFRVEEQRRLIGPSTILHTMEWEDRNYDKLIIAEDQDAWILYNYSTRYENNRDFCYILKDASKDLIASPVFYTENNVDRKALYILFNDDPNAVKAKVTVSEKFSVANTRYTLSFSTETKENGMFLFIQDVDYDIKSTSCQAHSSITDLLSGSSGGTYGIAKIELYDQNDVLIEKQNITISLG